MKLIINILVLSNLFVLLVSYAKQDQANLNGKPKDFIIVVDYEVNSDFVDFKLKHSPYTMEKINQNSIAYALIDTDDFLNQKRWSAKYERFVTAQDVTTTLQNELDTQFRKNRT